MERLTPKHGWTNASYDTWELCGLDSVCERDCWKPEPCKIPKMLYRLAEYEDLELTPSEIKSLLGNFGISKAMVKKRLKEEIEKLTNK